MKLKFKKLHENAVLPSSAKEGDAGLDLTAVSKTYFGDDRVQYDFGLAVEIPEGYVGLIFPRSSIHKKDFQLSNAVGVIDSGYRGSISAIFKYTAKGAFESKSPEEYNEGERIAQLVIIPYAKTQPEWSEELSDSERGTGGFGSTGS